MNIKIPKQIETNYININELIIEFVNVRNYEVPLNSLQIAVVDKVYNDCSKIIFHIDYKTSEQKTIEFEKHEVLFAKDFKRLYPDKFNALIQEQLKKKIK